MILTADYRGASIQMQTTSDVERSKRLHPAKAEPETVAFLESLPKGCVFYDIGANVGSYALVAAAVGLKTYAFEPPGPTFDRLEENVHLNLRYPVYAYPVLLGEEDRMVRFKRSSDEPGAALHKINSAGEPMRMQTLDSLVRDKNLPWPHAMKIDVDGNEIRVLLGASECLSHVRSIQIETDASSERDLRHFLGDRGFAETRVTPHEWSGVSNRVFERFEVVA